MAKKALPPKLIIQTGRWVWTTLWQTMMSQMAPRSTSGAYQRPTSQFRDRISAQPDARFPPAPDRYSLIVGMGCPWAHRTLIVRVLKGLQDAISIVIVQPSPENGGWIFLEPFAGCQSLAQLYQIAQPDYPGRSTVPVLWDGKTNTIVNNESSEIIEILNSEFNSLATNPEIDLYPEDQRSAIDTWNNKIYNTVNNGVYRCGFAQTQTAYQEAVTELFRTLDEIDASLATQPYLCGDRLTLADVRLFTTLIRFDIAYHGLFKCSYRRIQDYPHLRGYVQDLYQLPGIADTCDFETIRRDYYGNLFPLNPGGLIPISPDLHWLHQPSQRNFSPNRPNQ
ncbi:glutathione S-transferase family protein [Alkalinema sp. FACHB-956]|uniref:glutathione S-transferase family protein n=1 Tax=Alkalinema sp. FACHB-956 TaxID=2692768 RepID=UPI001689796D|nr:glutathione S-transferase family protein [Alkalinema sp. FACHB-956]MBD2327623.1 glutathione S-transferase family protein [Alkalinema sp. FACHB-956]